MKSTTTRRMWTVMRAIGAMGAIAMIGALSACGPLPTSAGTDMTTPSDDSALRRRARIKLELASAYYGKGDLNTALDEIKQAISLDPGLPEVYNMRGLIYAGIGNDDLAADSFRRALDLNPADADSMHNYAWFQCQRGQFAPADALFAKAMDQPQYRELTRTLLARGVCLGRAGNLEGAEGMLLRGYQLDPTNPAIATNLADVLYRQGKYDRARFYIRRVNDNPDLSNSETLWLAARIERKLHNNQGFNDLANQLRNRYPSSREALTLEQGRLDD